MGNWAMAIARAFIVVGTLPVDREGATISDTAPAQEIADAACSSDSACPSWAAPSSESSSMETAAGTPDAQR